MAKYGNKKTACLSKHVHDSKFEANYCDRLLAMKQSGEIDWYKIQVPFDLVCNHTEICTHIVDFLVHFPGKDNAEVHETKGMRTGVWIIKRKLFQACYPDIKYITIQLKQKRRKKWAKIGSRIP